MHNTLAYMHFYFATATKYCFLRISK